MSTSTQGTCDAAMYDMPSIMRDTPGLDEDDITRAPVQAAPYTMLIAATSLSACRKTRPSSGMRRERYSSNSVCGVMG